MTYASACTVLGVLFLSSIKLKHRYIEFRRSIQGKTETIPIKLLFYLLTFIYQVELQLVLSDKLVGSLSLMYTLYLYSSYKSSHHSMYEKNFQNWSPTLSPNQLLFSYTHTSSSSFHLTQKSFLFCHPSSSHSRGAPGLSGLFADSPATRPPEEWLFRVADSDKGKKDRGKLTFVKS